MKHISRGQEKQNHFFVHGGIFRACSSLLGKNQKVSLKLTARVVPHEFPHHISFPRLPHKSCFLHQFAREISGYAPVAYISNNFFTLGAFSLSTSMPRVKKLFEM